MFSRNNTDYLEESFVVFPSNENTFYKIVENDFPSLILQGDKASGKTHLSNIWLQKKSAVFFNSNESNLFNKNYVVEDLERLIGDKEQETKLFYLFNFVKENQRKILITLGKEFSSLQFVLKDLESRLKTLPICKIEKPEDDLLQKVMLKQFADRQLKIDHDVVNFIMKNFDRSYSSIQNIVQILDEKSLQDQRRITIPFVRTILFNKSN